MTEHRQLLSLTRFRQAASAPDHVMSNQRVRRPDGLVVYSSCNYELSGEIIILCIIHN